MVCRLCVREGFVAITLLFEIKTFFISFHQLIKNNKIRYGTTRPYPHTVYLLELFVRRASQLYGSPPIRKSTLLQISKISAELGLY